MKKVLSAILTFAMVFTMLPVGIVLASASGSDLWDGDYIYTVSDNEATITRYTGAGGDVTIPDTLGDGYAVTGIGNEAFSWCEALTSIDLPAGLTSIGYSAFESCTSLTSIELPAGVTGIDDYAFSHCEALASIELPASLTSIGYAAFNFCLSLTSIDLPDSLSVIGDGAFFWCEALTSIDLPAGLTSIGEDAFSWCTSLTSIDLPAGVTGIGTRAFAECASLTSVDLPFGVTVLADGVFWNCNSLTSIDLPAGLTSIGEGTFSRCAALTSIDLPAGLTSIGEDAFSFCEALTSIDLPDSLSVIGDKAFYSCEAMTAAYFYGNAPTTMGTDVFNHWASSLTVYYLSNKTGFTSPTWYTYPTAVFTPVSPDASVSITKLAEGFKVNIMNWQADYKYQLWSYQKIASDIFSGEIASQWMLSKPYTLGSGGTAETDGSISFTIADFTSPDSNYTIAVRITNAGGNYIGEIRDSYTPTDVSEVKIAKVLVDGEFSSGREIREIEAGAAMSFTVIGNDVADTVYTAKVVESGTSLTANSANEFGWALSALTPGMYTVQVTATNGETSDTKNIKVQLYSLDTGIQYGNISDLALTADEDNVLPKTLAITPDFTNGSFYYKVGEPGRTAIHTSGLFLPTDSIEYTFTKYGIYQVSGFVNREYEVKIGGYYDDGFIKQYTVNRSQTEPSTATLAATVNAEAVNLANPLAKGTTVLFAADAQIGGIGFTSVQYSFWRYDAKGYALVKDWSSDNTLDWTPARVGNYTIQVRAKGADAGSYEVAQSVKVTVTDATDQIAQGVVITVNEAELNLDAQARAPITVKANAASTNSEDLLYKFYVSDAAMGTTTLQSYSADSNCIWTPRKAGIYTISVLVKNDTSYGAYDAMEKFEITVN